MELRHLRYFIVAAEEQNFHRAAERLRVAQPALSRQIRDLEQELGATLFDRESRKVKLSAAGAVFLKEVRAILQRVELAAGLARRAAHGQAGSLRIAFNSLSARHKILPGCLDVFRRKQPDVEIKLMPMVAQQQLAALQRGDLDAGFLCFRPKSDSRLGHKRLLVEKMLVAMPANHRLAKQKRLKLVEFVDEPFVYFPRAHSPDMFDNVMQVCATGGLAPRIVHEAVAEEVLLGFVSVGMGLTFVPASMRGLYPESICFRQVSDFDITLQLDLVWLKTNRSAVLARFVESVSS